VSLVLSASVTETGASQEWRGKMVYRWRHPAALPGPPRLKARGLGGLSLLSLLCSHIISNYSGITYFPELSERGLLPTGVVLSAIRSFESRISLSSFMICRSCIQTNNGMNVKKIRKAQIARPNENSNGFMFTSRVVTYETLAEPKSGEDSFTSSA